MAHLWSDDGEGGWARTELVAATHRVPGAAIVSATGAWVLIAAPAVRVNGAGLVTGIQVLRDRDEIVVDARRLWFSTEARAAVAPYAGAEAVACPRCRLDVEPGMPAVVCPGCAVVHHERADELPCWTYAPRCAVCDQPTGLDADLRWTPETL